MKLELTGSLWQSVIFLILLTSGTTAQTQPVIANGFPIKLETANDLKASEGPVLADLDSDGELDIVLATGKRVYAFHSNGTPISGWPKTTTFSTTNSPAVGDINGDGNLDVVTFDREGFTRTSFLYAWDFQGQPLPGFPIKPGFGDFAVTLYDLNDDGKLEIIGGFGKKCFVFHYDGSVAQGWPQPLEPFYPISKASVGDVDADGKPEIIMAGVLDLPPEEIPEKTMGRLYVWNVNGELLPGWPITTSVKHAFVGWCNPALADINQDGFLEIAVGTYSFVEPNRVAYFALYRYDGTMMPGWPQFTAGSDSLNSFASSAAIADLDEDGQLDLIAGDIWDHVAAWKGDGTIVSGWPVIYGKVDSALVFRSTMVANPSVGDIDGDGHLEVLVNNNQADLINGVWLGRVYAFNHDAISLSWSPLRTRDFASFNTVALADLNSDGSLNLITVSTDEETWLTVWEVPGVPFVEDRFPWPMYGHDRWHTSQYGFKPPDEPKVKVEERDDSNIRPKDFVLHQNYPNPFSGNNNVNFGKKSGTVIRYELSEPAEVQLRLFNLLGEEVKLLLAAKKSAGQHEFHWEGRDQQGQVLPRGLYFYRLEAATLSNPAKIITRTQKLVLMN